MQQPVTTAFVAELEQEADATRTLLERVPEHELSWKPHDKSMSLGQLALHVAGLPFGVAQLLDDPVAEIPDAPYPQSKSVRELLDTLARSVTTARDNLRSWGDEGLGAEVTMTAGGETLAKGPRQAMVRTAMLNHWYHHRGQLTVYLRMLDVPLPNVYGPTADERT